MIYLLRSRSRRRESGTGSNNLSLGSDSSNGTLLGRDRTTLILDGGISSGSGLVGPLGRLSPFRVLPRPSIAHLAAARALTLATKLLGQVLGRDLAQQLLLVSGSEDVDLLDGDGIEPALDHAPDTAETPGGVDDVEPAQTLGVVVLAEVAGGADVAVDLAGLADADALEVHDGAAGLQQGAGFAAAGWQAWVGYALVLDGQVHEHAFLGRDLVHGCQVDATELLDVDWSAVLFRVSKEDNCGSCR
jgi:hypothetical protein